MFTQSLDQALKAAAENVPVKTAADAASESTIKKAAAGNQQMQKLAEDITAAGRLFAHGFINTLRKEAAAELNKAATLEGGHVSGSQVTEPGSVTDQANKLPTNKSKVVDEKQKHITEKDLKSPAKVVGSDSRINAASK